LSFPWYSFLTFLECVTTNTCGLRMSAFWERLTCTNQQSRLWVFGEVRDGMPPRCLAFAISLRRFRRVRRCYISSCGLLISSLVDLKP
jgi:hypothetical protein